MNPLEVSERDKCYDLPKSLTVSGPARYEGASPAAIRRAIAAEKEVAELRNRVQSYEQSFEAMQQAGRSEAERLAQANESVKVYRQHYFRMAAECARILNGWKAVGREQALQIVAALGDWHEGPDGPPFMPGILGAISNLRDAAYSGTFAPTHSTVQLTGEYVAYAVNGVPASLPPAREVDGEGKHDANDDEEIEVNERGGRQSRLAYRCDLLPQSALLSVAAVLKRGAEKYGENNWHSISTREHLNHALTHILKFLQGDTAEDHLDNAACRMLMALEIYNCGGSPIADESEAA